MDNPITKDGGYTTKNDGAFRQMFRCGKGKHRFSETGYCDLFGKHGSFKEYEQVCKLSGYGLSPDAIADVLGKDPRTITVWLRGISKKANLFHDVICLSVTLTVLFIQMDELWSYLKNKNSPLWVFVGFEVESRFWMNFEVGSRTTHTATKLVGRLRQLIGKASRAAPLKISTDKLAAYKNALQSVFTDIEYVYLQIVKKRIKMRLVTVKKFFVKGTAADFKGKSQNTSYIERFNLTLRQRVSYLHRKTLGYCKKKANLTDALWINLYDYNYRRHHKSLRVPVGQPSALKFQKKWVHRTPAMAMGLTQEALTWKFLLVAPVRLTC
jgi:IS1 family transposase/DNA-binding CsgD family transcriptional regulator